MSCTFTFDPMNPCEMATDSVRDFFREEEDAGGSDGSYGYRGGAGKKEQNRRSGYPSERSSNRLGEYKPQRYHPGQRSHHDYRKQGKENYKHSSHHGRAASGRMEKFGKEQYITSGKRAGDYDYEASEENGRVTLGRRRQVITSEIHQPDEQFHYYEEVKDEDDNNSDRIWGQEDYFAGDNTIYNKHHMLSMEEKDSNGDYYDNNDEHQSEVYKGTHTVKSSGGVEGAGGEFIDGHKGGNVGGSEAKHYSGKRRSKKKNSTRLSGEGNTKKRRGRA